MDRLGVGPNRVWHIRYRTFSSDPLPRFCHGKNPFLIVSRPINIAMHSTQGAKSGNSLLKSHRDKGVIEKFDYLHYSDGFSGCPLYLRDQLHGCLPLLTFHPLVRVVFTWRRSY